MLSYTDGSYKTAAVREYEAKVQESFQRYHLACLEAEGQNNLPVSIAWADARAQYVAEIASLRAQFDATYPNQAPFGG